MVWGENLNGTPQTPILPRGINETPLITGGHLFFLLFESGTFEVVCKCMSGFTDKYYAEMKDFYNNDDDSEKNINTSKHKKEYYEALLCLAIWFEPKEVWEIAFADTTLNPTYSAAIGLVSEDRGLSLRFLRFLRKREDKGIEEASAPQFLAGILSDTWLTCSASRFILQAGTRRKKTPESTSR